MISDSAFIVYNAAAGAGKTYTLVKAYLSTLLTAEFKDGYKNILALTFTNKAVTEMKNRVLENLVGISQPNTPEKFQSLLQELVVETKIPEPKLKQKADRILKSIIHNYAAFDIVTIDTFTHRVIRTFAYDLGIPMNFEIEMDTESLIEEAVNAVLSKVGIEPEITKIVIDFAISKIEDDKSWDITSELNKVAKLLHSENDRDKLNQLRTKTFQDFAALRSLLKQKIASNKKELSTQAKDILQLIEEKGLENTNFKGSYIPKYFIKLLNNQTNIDFSKSVWMQNIDTTDFYNKSLDEIKKGIIDAIRPKIEERFLQTKKKILEIDLFENIIKNLIPLSVLNTINRELVAIKKEQKLILISEFNSIIGKAIQNQPAPFIYERLGERYRDYFIDEFQDTSALQWTNLVPLVDNALSTETLTGKRGKLTIVGDAKQAIYRWRGGKAEQFISLSNDQNPFSIEDKQVCTLPKNYRSHQNIIAFNNDFFSFVAKDFSDPKHSELYLTGNQQEYNHKEHGHVNISFIKALNAEEEAKLYPEKVYESIDKLQKKGYTNNEICILVRKQKEGIAIANFLTEKGLSIISSETLLINNATEVQFIINLLTWHQFKTDLLAKTQMLNFLAEKIQIENKHAFLENTITAQEVELSNILKGIGFDFNPKQLSLQPLYSAIEYIITCFKLNSEKTAYMQFFLDTVFAYVQKNTEGISSFLTYWEQKKEKLSVVAPEGQDAIRIMTIHKAKGLEFPCVIYPYANTDIYKEIEPKTWLSVPEEDYCGFDQVFINYNKKIADYNDQTREIVKKRQSQLELDNINLLYVACTRAIEQLYIISKADLTSKGVPNSNKFSGKLINYLQHKAFWNPEIMEYTFGPDSRPFVKKQEVETMLSPLQLATQNDNSEKYHINIVTNASKLWDTSQQLALEKGNLIHDLLSKIYTENDIKTIIEEAHNNGAITFSDKEVLYNQLKKVVCHPELTKYFKEELTVLNERDIIAHQQSYRPDRIIVQSNKKTSIIDYKTGSYSSSHENQLHQYATVLEKMGYHIEDKILVYINKNIALKHV